MPRSTASPAPRPQRPAASAASLERFLSTQLLVWIAAAAVTLAGIFFVKHSYETGLLRPEVRLVIAGIFGLGLWFAAEWLRARAAAGARLAQPLAAAAVAVLFGTVLASVWIEQLIPPLLAAAIMTAITALAVALSLRHGPLVAVLGLLGGLVTPGLLGQGRLGPGFEVAYLLLLQAGVLLVNHRRGWWPISGLMLLGAVVWSLLWLLIERAMPSGLLGSFVLISAAGFILATAGTVAARIPAPILLTLRMASGLFAVFMVTAMTPVHGFGLLEWFFVGLLGLGTLAVARLDPRCMPLPALAAAATLCLLWWWAGPYYKAFPVDADIISAALAFGLLYGGGALLAMWRSPRPDLWVGLSVAAVIAHLLTAYQLIHVQKPGLFGGLCLVLAVAYAAVMAPLLLRRAVRARAEAALTILAVGITALLALAIAIELPDRWIGVAWAIQAGLMTLPHLKLRIVGLRPLIAAVAAAGAVWLLILPGPWDADVTGPAVFNILSLTYGLPLLAAVGGAYALRKWGDASVSRHPAMPPKLTDERLAAGLEVFAAVLALAAVALQVRYGFHGSIDMLYPTGLLEAAAFVLLLLLAAHALLAVDAARARPALAITGLVFAFLGLVVLVIGPLLWRNPMFTPEPVGAMPVFNWLLYIYGLPAALLAALSLWFDRGTLPEQWNQETRDRLRMGIAAMSLLLLLVLVTLEVRQSFRGPVLDGGSAAEAEVYAYSAAWTVLGMVLLVAGLLLRSVALRWASLLVLILAAGKIFLYDTRQLENLYRVAAFLGLGAVLLALAYLYQRFVFRPAAQQ